MATTPFIPHGDDILLLADGSTVLRHMLDEPEHEQVIEGYEVLTWMNDPAMLDIHPSWNVVTSSF